MSYDTYISLQNCLKSAVEQKRRLLASEEVTDWKNKILIALLKTEDKRLLLYHRDVRPNGSKWEVTPGPNNLEMPHGDMWIIDDLLRENPELGYAHAVYSDFPTHMATYDGGSLYVKS